MADELLIIHDKRLPDEYKKAISRKLPNALLVPFAGAQNVIANPPYDSICCHPDIYLYQIDKKSLIYAPSTSKEFIKELERYNIGLIKGQKTPSGKYPDTVCYNALRVGNSLFHNLSYTDPMILEIAEYSALKRRDVAQGYSRCSAIVISDVAVVTSDKGLAGAIGEEGLEALVVSKGFVELPGERYGFLGGASGNLADGRLLLSGDLEFHPDAKKIKDFFKKHAVEWIELEGLPLYDAGGFIILERT